MRYLALFLLLCLLGLMAWWGRTHAERARTTGPAPVAALASRLVLTPPTNAVAGLENVVKVTDHLYSGGEPDGEAAFAALERLGVRTIVSVDGLRPNVEAARRHGLRYVHLPIGYDGVPAETGRALARVARECTPPVYVHCHHGKHRGPAATAILCQAMGDADSKEALTILKLAGTGEEYRGLWRDVASYRPPAAGEPLPTLVEWVPGESLAGAMANLDRAWDRVQVCENNDWQSPPDHPDVTPAQEAVLVEEAFREAIRLKPENDLGEDFGTRLNAALAIAESMKTALDNSDHAAAGAAFAEMARSCKECHRQYRD